MADGLRVLIVDDEPLARESLRLLLEAHPDVVTVGEVADGRQAVEAIRSLPLDLVLLDVQMPGLGGFDVIREVGVQHMPPVVFVTAYDRYALRAFEVSALDYLLKPFSNERFTRAMARARRNRARDARGELVDQLSAMLGALEDLRRDSSATSIELIPVSRRNHVRLVDPADIAWVEAADDYVRLHVNEASYLLRATMRNMERRLCVRGFHRVHRSYLVNLDFIEYLERLPRGDYTVVLRDGTRLPLSRNRRKVLTERMNLPL